MEFSGVNNHGLSKLSFEILCSEPTSLGEDEIVWMTTQCLASASLFGLALGPWWFKGGTVPPNFTHDLTFHLHLLLSFALIFQT